LFDQVQAPEEKGRRPRPRWRLMIHKPLHHVGREHASLQEIERRDGVNGQDFRKILEQGPLDDGGNDCQNAVVLRAEFVSENEINNY